MNESVVVNGSKMPLTSRGALEQRSRRDLALEGCLRVLVGQPSQSNGCDGTLTAWMALSLFHASSLVATRRFYDMEL